MLNVLLIKLRARNSQFESEMMQFNKVNGVFFKRYYLKVPSPKDNIVCFFHKYMSSYHVCKDSKSTLNCLRLNCVTKTCNYLRRRNAWPIDAVVTVMFELLALFFNYTHEVMMVFIKRQKFTIAFLFWVARYSVSLMETLAILKILLFVIRSLRGHLPFVLSKILYFCSKR